LIEKKTDKQYSNVAKNVDALENVATAYYPHSLTRSPMRKLSRPSSRTSPVVQNDTSGYDLDEITEPFFREDNPAGSSGGSFIMHGHL